MVGHLPWKKGPSDGGSWSVGSQPASVKHVQSHGSCSVLEDTWIILDPFPSDLPSDSGSLHLGKRFLCFVFLSPQPSIKSQAPSINPTSPNPRK